MSACCMQTLAKTRIDKVVCFPVCHMAKLSRKPLRVSVLVGFKISLNHLLMQSCSQCKLKIAKKSLPNWSCSHLVSFLDLKTQHPHLKKQKLPDLKSKVSLSLHVNVPILCHIITSCRFMEVMKPVFLYRCFRLQKAEH